jgi:hypothetical protein
VGRQLPTAAAGPAGHNIMFDNPDAFAEAVSGAL